VTQRFAAIIPAAGLGTRLAESHDISLGGAPKALRRIAGRSMLQRTVHVFAEHVDEIVVAVPPDFLRHIELDEPGTRVTVVAGGATRQQSVRHALDAMTDSVTHVLVHDAARALVPGAVVRRVKAALSEGATCVVPVVPVSDSLRAVSPSGSNAPLDRAAVRLVQTPQGFEVTTLRRGHSAAVTDLATDDATLVEAVGETVTLVDGDPLAFKITRPLDLVLAEAVLGQRESAASRAVQR
jgi:2-C-methyl-D-erythritol 4-phosphate cytidylyltransferase